MPAQGFALNQEQSVLWYITEGAIDVLSAMWTEVSSANSATWHRQLLEGWASNGVYALQADPGHPTAMYLAEKAASATSRRARRVP